MVSMLKQNKSYLFLIMCLIIFLICGSLTYFSLTHVKYVSGKEFFDDWKDTNNDGFANDFESYNDGDIAYIKDTISEIYHGKGIGPFEIEYDHTVVKLKSLEGYNNTLIRNTYNYTFDVHTNLTDFKVGDEIIILVRIESDTDPYQSDKPYENPFVHDCEMIYHKNTFQTWRLAIAVFAVVGEFAVIIGIPLIVIYFKKKKLSLNRKSYPFIAGLLMIVAGGIGLFWYFPLVIGTSPPPTSYVTLCSTYSIFEVFLFLGGLLAIRKKGYIISLVSAFLGMGINGLGTLIMLFAIVVFGVVFGGLFKAFPQLMYLGGVLFLIFLLLLISTILSFVAFLLILKSKNEFQ